MGKTRGERSALGLRCLREVAPLSEFGDRAAHIHGAHRPGPDALGQFELAIGYAPAPRSGVRARVGGWLRLGRADRHPAHAQRQGADDEQGSEGGLGSGRRSLHLTCYGAPRPAPDTEV